MTILEKIFATKKEEIIEAKRLISPAELRAQAADVGPRRGFRQAIVNSQFKPALIAEVKKASPSQGLIVQGEFKPDEIATAYEANGATCISVLTDVNYFMGAPSYLSLVRETVSVPLLRKDFMCDPYQLDEALVWGADCILLIVAGIEKSVLFDLYAEAKHRQLDVLVEIHDEAEAETALELGADMIGINNRNLKNFEENLAATERLIRLIPDDVVRISESSLNTNQDVVNMASFGADAVLIGTAFCRASDIGAKVREVIGR